MIKQIRYVFAAGVLAASGAVSASTCPSAISSYNLCSGTPAQIAQCQADIRGSHPECFGGASGSVAAATKSVQATSLETMLVISSNISNRGATLAAPPGKLTDTGERKGLAAGNPAGKWNVWGSFAESDTEYDRGTFFFNTANRVNRFETRIDNFVLGGDYQWAPNLAIGLSASFDRGRGSATSHSVGAAAADQAPKALSTSGTSFAPYVGWQINKDWALDATVGWGDGNSTIAGSVTTDTKRFFYGTNVSYSSWHGNWQMTGKGGYLFGQEKNRDSKNNGVVTANTAVTNEIGQFRLAGQAAYWMNGVMPYFGLAYSSDNRSSTATAGEQDATAMGKSAFVWSLGANFISIKNAMTGGIGYEQETGRSRSKNNKLMANINVRF